MTHDPIRAARAREMFPNAPEYCNCRMCGAQYANPILEGAGIASSVCPVCKLGMFSEKTRRRMMREGEITKSENERAVNTQTQPLVDQDLPIRSLRSFSRNE